MKGQFSDTDSEQSQGDNPLIHVERLVITKKPLLFKGKTLFITGSELTKCYLCRKLVADITVHERIEHREYLTDND